MTNTTRKPLFARLKQGLEDGISHAQGTITLKTTKAPDAPPTIDAKTLKALRAASGLSQMMFARVLNVSPKTLQSWEHGSRTPSDAAMRLIEVFTAQPEVFSQVVGMEAIKLPGVTIKKAKVGLRRIEVRGLKKLKSRG